MVVHLHVAVSVLLSIAATAPAQASWTRLYSAASPSQRGQFAFAADPVRGSVLLFGGNINNSGITAELWQWNGSTWTLTPPGGPTPRVGSAMAFDEGLGRIVLFGGNNGNTYAAPAPRARRRSPPLRTACRGSATRFAPASTRFRPRVPVPCS